MNKNIKLAVAGAVLALSASADAGIIIPAGDWTLDIGGNVNTFVTNTRSSGSATITGGYSSFVGNANSTTEKNESNLTTGLLPNYLSVSGTTRQNDLDVAFTISINPGSSTSQGGRQSAQQENRQAFLTFGDKSWGSVKLGKDLGVFAGTAILNDMTLLGVGSGAGGLGSAGNTTTIGGIGTGYIYADWKAQAAYTSPNFSGFQFTLAATQGWNTIANDSTNSLATTGRSGSAPAAEGQISYSWTGATSGKLWTSGIVQKINHNSTTVALDDDRAQAADIGASITMGDLGLVGYAYKGDGIGTTIQFMDAYTVAGKQRKSDGGYAQLTYVLPSKTKIGLAYGISNLDRNSTEVNTNLVKENERTTLGAYHPLTKHLNLVAEYNDARSQNQAGAENKSRTISLGGILFF